MANTKLTKRKEEGDTQQVKSDSDSESELPQNLIQLILSLKILDIIEHKMLLILTQI